MTIAERLQETDNRPTGFDYLRIALAIFIVCWHSIVTSYGQATQDVVGAAIRPCVAILLPMFFALSGFLVAGSLERCKTIGFFLGLRGVRILPALAVEVTLSALILGPLLTTLPLHEYFSSRMFFGYFQNMLGHPHYRLPGVFLDTPTFQVNGQLWTVPWELQCYIAIATLSLLGVTRRRYLLLPAIAALLIYVVISTDAQAMTPGALPGWFQVIGFLGGVWLYLYRDRVKYRASWGAACLGGGFALLAVPYGHFLAILVLPYATVWLGLTNFRKIGILRGADYSYGIFLYSFVIEQTFVSLGPWARHWWLIIALSLPTACLISALSWHFVEKPALELRRPLKSLETWWLSRRSFSLLPARRGAVSPRQ